MKRRSNLRLLMPVAAVLVSMVASCGKTDLPGTQDPDPNPSSDQNGTAFFAAHIGISAGSTKTFEYDDPGSNNEKQVNSVYIVLYNAGDGEIAYRFDLEANNTDTYNVTGSGVVPKSNGAFYSKAQEVAKTDYKMVALINPYSDILDYTEPGSGYTLADFENLAAMPTIADITENAGVANNFFMTNANGPRLIKKENLQRSAIAAETPVNTFSVNVERTIARIDAVKDASFTLGSNIQIVGDIKWTVDNTNKRTYWMRHASITPNGTAEKRDYTTDNLNPILTPMEELHATDPNMTIEDSRLVHELNRLRPIASNISAFDKTLSATAGSVYVLENTLDASEQVPGKVEERATRVLFSANVMYKSLDGETNVTDYFSYGDKVFTRSMANVWVESGVYPADLGAGFPAAITAAKAAGIFDFSTATGFTPAAYTEYSGMIYHKDGLNIYPVIIRHFDTDQNAGITAADRGYYGVVRNNIYQVNLKGIAGKSEADNKTFASAYVWIRNFTYRTQDAEF